MSFRVFGVLIFGLSVSACGPAVDDPANVPKLGKWYSHEILERVTLDGESFWQDNIPDELANMFGGHRKSKELGCTEPKVLTVTALNEKLPSNIADMCTLVPTSNDPLDFSFESQCDPSKFPENTERLDFTGKAITKENRVTMNLKINIATKSDDGQITNMKIERDHIFARVGECAS